MPPKRYEATDPQTGRTIEFDWDGPTPPSDADVASAFSSLGAAKTPAMPEVSAPPPTGPLGILDKLKMAGGMLTGNADVAANPQTRTISDLIAGTAPKPAVGALERASDLLTTPLVPEATRTKIGSTIGGYTNTPIQYQGVSDTVKGILEGLYNISPFADMATRQAAQRAAVGGAVEGALTQTSPLDILALGEGKALKAIPAAGKLARAGLAGGSAVVAAGGVQQAADSGRALPERLAGAGKAALGVVGMMAPVLGAKAKPPQIAPESGRYAQLLAEREAAAVPEANPFNPGGSLARLKADYVDALAPLQRFQKQAGVAPAPEANPLSLGRLAVGGTGGQYRVIEHEVQGIKDAAEASGLLDQLRYRLDLGGMAHAGRKIAGKEGGAEKLASGVALPAGYTPDTVAGELRQFGAALAPEAAAQVEKWAGQIDNLLAENLKSVTGTFISEKGADSIRKMGSGYIPQWRKLQKPLEAAAQVSGQSLDPVTQKIVKAIQGSEKVTVDPFDATVKMLQQSQRLKNQNAVTEALYNLKSSNPSNPFLAATIRDGAAGVGEKTLHFWRDGKRMEFAVPEGVADAINFASIDHPGDMMRGILGTAQKMYRAAVTTLNAPFSIRNVIRDPQDARRLLPGDQGYISPTAPVKTAGATADFYRQYAREVGRELKNMVKGVPMLDDPAYQDMLRAGGGFSGLQSQFGLAPEYANNPVLRSLAEFANRMEQTTKVFSWKRLKAAGYSDIEAALLTRAKGGSPDFAVRGNKSPSANLLFLFFNAKVQGIARNIESLSTNPGKFGGQLAKKLVGPAATLYAFDRWNNTLTDEDGVRTIDKIPATVKTSNYVVVTPFTVTGDDGKQQHLWIPVPMGHYNQLTHSLMRLGSEAVGATNDTTVPQAAANVATNLLPMSGNLDASSMASLGKSAITGTAAGLNPVLRFPLEYATNYDMGLGRQAIPEAVAQQMPEFQTTATTSPTAKAIADVFNLNPTNVKLSPAQLENLINKVPVISGPVSMLDRVVRGNGPDLRPIGQQLRDIPLVGSFARVGGSAAKSDAYERLFSKLNRSMAANTTARAAEEGDDEEKLNRILGDEGMVEAIDQLPELQSLAKELSEIRKEKRAVAGGAKKGNRDQAIRDMQQLTAEENQLLYDAQSYLGGLDPRLKPTTKFGARRDQIEKLLRKFGAR